MKRLIPPLLFAVLVILLFADPLFTGRVFSGRDLVAYNHPMEKQIHDAWGRGHVPVWYDQISGGRPLAPNPNAGALYPVRALFALLPFEEAMRWFPVLHWIVAGWGVALLLGALGGGRAACWLAAVTYVFSGVQMALVFLPNLHPGAALMPWVIWSVVRWNRSGREAVWITAALIGLDLLAGDVFTVSMGVAVSGLWIVLALSRGRVIQLARLAAVCGLSLLLAAPLVAGSLLWAPQTTRAVVGLNLREALGFSLSPWRILELAIPYPFGDTWAVSPADIWGWSVFQGNLLGMFGTLYAGAFSLVALVRLSSDRRPEARFALWVAALALALSVLPSLVPRSWAGLRAPLPLRNPEKFAILLEVALALAVGLAFEAGALARFRRLALGAAAVLAVAAVVASARPRAAGRIALLTVGTRETAGQSQFAAANPLPAAASRLPWALAEGGLLWAATAVGLDLSGRGTRRARASAAVLLGLVPVAANQRLPLTFSKSEAFAPSAFARMVGRREPEGAFRVLGEALFGGDSSLMKQAGRADPGGIDTTRLTWLRHTQALWNVGTIFNVDFDAGDLFRLEGLRRTAVQASRYSDSGSFFADLSLRWGIRFRDQAAVAGFRRIGGDGLQDWDENPAARPDIRWVERWREVESPVAAWAELPRLSSGEVILETGDRRESTAKPAAIQVTKRSPEQLRITVAAVDPGWVFVLRGWWPYRTVRVDDRIVDAVPAQVAFSAVPVPAGTHRIEWTEELPGWTITRWGPVTFVIVAVALFARDRRRGARG